MQQEHVFYDGVSRVDAAYEQVKQPDATNVVLEFRPDPPQTRLVGCVWSHWRPTKRRLTAPGAHQRVTPHFVLRNWALQATPCIANVHDALLARTTYRR